MEEKFQYFIGANAKLKASEVFKQHDDGCRGMYVWMDGWVDVCMYVYMDGWMDGCG